LGIIEKRETVLLEGVLLKNFKAAIIGSAIHIPHSEFVNPMPHADYIEP
jgi:hypothetical protein